MKRLDSAIARAIGQFMHGFKMIDFSEKVLYLSITPRKIRPDEFVSVSAFIEDNSGKEDKSLVMAVPGCSAPSASRKDIN